MSQRHFCIGDIIGPETIDREYKAFHFKSILTYFSETELTNLLTCNNPIDTIRFNQMSDTIIASYIDKYLTKYLGTFSKANISGCLYIGIDDDGIIEGIPHFGSIDSSVIKKLILDTKINVRGVVVDDNDNKVYDQSIIDWFYNNMLIEIIQIQYPIDHDILFEQNTVSDRLTKIINLNNQKIDVWNQYLVVHKQWITERNRYGGKLLNYLIDQSLTQELIDFIQTNFDNNPSLDKTKLNTIFDFYNKDSSFYTNCVFDIDYISSIHDDIYNPIYWLITFKDHILVQLKHTKPFKPIEKPITNIYGNFCATVPNIRPFIFSQHPNNYLIRITIPSMYNTYLEYRSSTSSEWLSKERTLIEDGPSKGPSSN